MYFFVLFFWAILSDVQQYSWWCLGDQIGCPGLNPGQSHTMQVPYPLYYLLFTVALPPLPRTLLQAPHFNHGDCGLFQPISHHLSHPGGRALVYKKVLRMQFLFSCLFLAETVLSQVLLLSLLL